MAEERNLALPRAVAAPGDEDATKQELQRRMEEARESITQTVSEIKENVSTQYQNVRDALDWREHYRRRPLAFSLSALGVGLLAGYGLGHLVVGESRASRYADYEEDYDEGNGRAAARSYAALAPAVTASAKSSASRAQADSSERVSHAPNAGGILDVGPDSSPSSYAIGGSSEASTTTASEADKPGLMSRFKETKAYDRLQEEVSTIGDRILEELSRTAQTVVLPALFNKIKDMIGVDLTRQQAGGRGGATGAQQTGGSAGQRASATGATATGGGQSPGMSADDDMTREQRPQATGGASQSARAGGSAAGGSATGGGTSYGTSENKGYGSSS